METVVTSIKMNFGIPFEAPCGEIKLLVGIGAEESAAIRAEIQEKTGLIPSEILAHIVIPCVSAQGADNLKSLLSSIWDAAHTTEAPADLFALAIKNALLSNPEHPGFSAQFAVHNKNVIVVLSPQSDKLDQITSFYRNLKETLSKHLGSRQQASLNVSLGRSISDILSSRNLLVGLWQSMKLEFDLEYSSSLPAELLTMASEIGPSANLFIEGLRSLSNYEGMTMNLNYCDASQIPQAMKDAMKTKFNVDLYKAQINQLFGSLVPAFAQHSEGEVDIVVGMIDVMAELKIKLPGFSEFLSLSN